MSSSSVTTPLRICVPAHDAAATPILPTQRWRETDHDAYPTLAREELTILANLLEMGSSLPDSWSDRDQESHSKEQDGVIFGSNSQNEGDPVPGEARSPKEYDDERQPYWVGSRLCLSGVSMLSEECALVRTYGSGFASVNLSVGETVQEEPETSAHSVYMPTGKPISPCGTEEAKEKRRSCLPECDMTGSGTDLGREELYDKDGFLVEDDVRLNFSKLQEKQNRWQRSDRRVSESLLSLKVRHTLHDASQVFDTGPSACNNGALRRSAEFEEQYKGRSLSLQDIALHCKMTQREEGEERTPSLNSQTSFRAPRHELCTSLRHSASILSWDSSLVEELVVERRDIIDAEKMRKQRQTSLGLDGYGLPLPQVVGQRRVLRRVKSRENLNNSQIHPGLEASPEHGSMTSCEGRRAGLSNISVLETNEQPPKKQKRGFRISHEAVSSDRSGHIDASLGLAGPIKRACDPVHDDQSTIIERSEDTMMEENRHGEEHLPMSSCVRGSFLHVGSTPDARDKVADGFNVALADLQAEQQLENTKQPKAKEEMEHEEDKKAVWCWPFRKKKAPSALQHTPLDRPPEAGRKRLSKPFPRA